MRVPAEALSALCNGEIRGTTLPSRLVGFVCLSVTMVTADLYCLWNRVYSGVVWGWSAVFKRLYKASNPSPYPNQALRET